MPLKGIPKVLTPNILHALSSMGHGDEIVLADAHFPASSVAKSSNCGTIEIRADGCDTLPYLLESILKFFPLDEYAQEAIFLMDRVDSDKASNLIVKVWKEFDQILELSQGKEIKPKFVERFQFYEQAKRAYAIIQTGDVAQYGNIILKKGLVMN
ncbi:fucose mutarotase-like [Brachionus plicatilis]|uniref:L-fucose mutarotase n=1 Tax=Brachionus plicatilis TaxID=10195 RepID=A0A3M7R7A2_BRAPC|nr:fucose mutarotase-like [Brachionus plicatilis]